MKMLINATRAEQLRVAVVDGTILQEFQVQIDESGLTRGNIYRGVVANIQPSLNAAFIDIGEERHGFLPVADVLPTAYHKKPPKGGRRPSVDQVLEKGRKILVQVTKDGVGQKGAALTTNIALAGRYLVLTPFDSVRGISRKAEDDSSRKKIKDRLKKLKMPDGHGVIVRTNGIDQNQATLNRDLNALLRLWRKVQDEAERGRGARLLYSDQDLVVQAMRDYLDPEIDQVIVDHDDIYEKAEEYMKAFMPRSKTELVRYKDRLPLFSRFRLESQIDKIYDRTASLPSGASIVIDQTEALTAIDVNSGRATRTSNHEESIFKINCEAAEEVARQLRLRDIGGLVVVDFIDMRLRKHQGRLEKIMRDAMKPDKARWSVGRISPNGLLEINRQRIKQSLRLRTHRPCPTCAGLATIPTPDFAALRILSRIEGRAASGRIKSVTVALHPEMADILQNHFRRELMGLESDHEIEIEVIAAPTLRRTEERLDWTERSKEDADRRARAAQRSEPAFSATDLTAESKRRSRRGRGGKGKDDERDERQQAKSSQKSGSGQQSKSGRDQGEKDQDGQGRDGHSQDGNSRRRKRSRRRGKGGDQDADQTAESQQSQSTQADDEDDDQKPRRRSRRRGGRRRKRGSEDQQASQEDTSSKASEDQDDEDGSEASGRSRSRRRRRGGRGRGRSSRSGDAAESNEQQKADSRNDASDDPDDNRSAQGDDESTKKTVRRRSRRRKTAQGDQDDSQASTEKAEAKSSRAKKTEADEGKDDESAEKTVRRRSRRRKTSDDENDEAPKETPKQARSKKPEAKDAGGQADTDEDKPQVRKRRRSSRRSAQDDSGDAKKTENKAKADGPKAPPETSDTSGNGDESATKTRRRSRRRHSDESDEKGSQAKADGDGSGSAAKGEPKPPKPEADVPPIGVLAGQNPEQRQPEAKGKRKLRWQWWGGPSDPAPDPNED